MAARFGMDFLDTVSESMIDTSLVAKLPVEWARSHSLLPVRIDGKLCVLTADPARIADREYLELLLGEELRPVVAPAEVIASNIERCYFRRDDSPEDFLREMKKAPGQKKARPATNKAEDLLQIAAEAPVAHLVNLILLEAMKARASDIHFEPYEERMRVRYRVDGKLYEQSSPPKHMELPLVSRLKVMAHMDIAEKRLPQDGMARVRVGEREIDIRVSTVPVAEGERVVLRLLDRDSSLIPLTDLGMGEDNLRLFRSLLELPNGLILVTGPTGSGKTTTLYAALQELDSDGTNIMTIEDPIEYQLHGIGQMQVKPKIGLTFAAGLRHILRQDPDIILVGETRDIETAETAARCSLTGHLVFSTLHTNDAPSAVVRMIDMGVEPYLLAASLRAALAQRLVRRLCEKCRQACKPTDAELGALGSLAEQVAGRTVWKPVGCRECLGGYRGRVGVYELMDVDPEMSEAIRSGRGSVAEIRAAASRKGMSTLLADGVRKALAGTTSLSEILHALGKPEEA
jgi:general secretion pathway protein E